MTDDKRVIRKPITLDDLEKMNEASNKSLEAYAEKVLARLKKVTPALFAEFLTERGASKHCINCGSSQLSVGESISGSFTGTLPSNLKEMPISETSALFSSYMTSYVTFSRVDPDKRLSIHNAQYSATCLHCGFMTQYRAFPVVNWLEDKVQVEE